jgi:hypothetical protein
VETSRVVGGENVRTLGSEGAIFATTNDPAATNIHLADKQQVCVPHRCVPGNASVTFAQVLGVELIRKWFITTSQKLNGKGSYFQHGALQG